MSDLPDDLGIPMKPARPPGQTASIAPLGRTPTPMPPRMPDMPRPAVDMPKPGDAARPPAAAATTPLAAQRPREGESRKLIVGREITLSGEIKSFTGVSDPYEEPLKPELIVDSSTETVDQSLGKLLGRLEELNYINKGARR